MVALAITPKGNGGSYISPVKNSSRPSFVSFSVVKQGHRYRLSHFGIQCVVSPSNVGNYILQKGPTISSSGAFSFTGKIAVYKANKTGPIGSATIKLSGRFTSSTKAKGSAVISNATPTLSGCPGESFTASYVQYRP
jgi:hypothetical protein